MHVSISNRYAQGPAPDLPALINLHESNYVRLMRLMPDLVNLRGTVVSRVSGAQDLYLSVDDRYKYTTNLMLTYCFKSSLGVVLEPRATICVYHDVRAVDLVSHCRRHRSRKLFPWSRRGHMPELDRRWEMNRFLYKWLRFCTHQGHLFLNFNVQAAPDPRLQACSVRASRSAD